MNKQPQLSMNIDTVTVSTTPIPVLANNTTIINPSGFAEPAVEPMAQECENLGLELFITFITVTRSMVMYQTTFHHRCIKIFKPLNGVTKHPFMAQQTFHGVTHTQWRNK